MRFPGFILDEIPSSNDGKYVLSCFYNIFSTVVSLSLYSSEKSVHAFFFVKLETSVGFHRLISVFQVDIPPCVSNADGGYLLSILCFLLRNA
jgi:hypothetical protein